MSRHIKLATDFARSFTELLDAALWEALAEKKPDHVEVLCDDIHLLSNKLEYLVDRPVELLFAQARLSTKPSTEDAIFQFGPEPSTSWHQWARQTSSFVASTYSDVLSNAHIEEIVDEWLFKEDREKIQIPTDPLEKDILRDDLELPVFSYWVWHLSQFELETFIKHQSPARIGAALEMECAAAIQIAATTPGMDVSTLYESAEPETARATGHGAGQSGHAWDSEAERFANRYRKRFDAAKNRMETPPTIDDFCESEAGKATVTPATLAKKLKQYRDEWDPEKRYYLRKPKAP